MHTHSMDRWRHDHTFGQERPAAGERRTLVVVAITAVTMVVEVGAGIWTGSMALLADGVHMASHVLALGIAAFAYVYARRHARDERFSFGTGKVNALAGFTGALLLAVVALLGAKYLGATWLDPVMGIVGAVLVANWSRGLLGSTTRVLLDHQASEAVRDGLRKAIELGNDWVADLHVWSVGPGVHAAIVSVVTHEPKEPDHYRDLVPDALGIRHLSVEVNRCA